MLVMAPTQQRAEDESATFSSFQCRFGPFLHSFSVPIIISLPPNLSGKSGEERLEESKDDQ